jgi:hypothetical protein
LLCPEPRATVNWRKPVKSRQGMCIGNRDGIFWDQITSLFITFAGNMKARYFSHIIKLEP